MPPPGAVMQDSLPFNPSAIQRRVATMVWRWLFLIILAAALPARADDLVSMTQVVAARVAGALPSDPFGNVSVIYQSGSGNVGQTDQTGTRGSAVINQTGNNNSSLIQQTGAGNSAVNTQIGNGLTMTIRQTGPGQAISITQRR